MCPLGDQGGGKRLDDLNRFFHFKFPLFYPQAGGRRDGNVIKSSFAFLMCCLRNHFNNRVCDKINLNSSWCELCVSLQLGFWSEEANKALSGKEQRICGRKI